MAAGSDVGAFDVGELASLTAAMSEYYTLARASSEKLIRGERDEEAVTSLKVMTEQYNTIKSSLDANTTGYRTAMKEAFKTTRDNQAKSRDIVLGTTILCILLLGTLALWISRAVTRPVAALARVAGEIAFEDLTNFAREATLMAGGDLTRVPSFREYTIPIETQDEFGRMGRSFQIMVAKLGEIGESINVMAAGLSDIVLQVQTAADELAMGSQALARSTATAAGSNRSTVEAVDGIASTIHEMGASMQNVTASTQSQASSSAETRAAIESIALSLDGVAGAADRMAGLADKATESMVQGRRNMQETSEGMSASRDKILQAAEATVGLGTMATNIGTIVRVIEEIADQTHLLALNAAIEAARAGDHSLGFAVVADEVGRLAERSRTATEEISELVTDMQSQVRGAVDKMEGSTPTVDEGMQRTQALEDSLTEMVGAVTEVTEASGEIRAATAEHSAGAQQIEQATVRLSELTHEIRAATEEQSAGADSVVVNIEHIRTMVQANAEGADELADPARSLQGQAALMRKAVSRFRTARGGSGSGSDARVTKGDLARVRA